MNLEFTKSTDTEHTVQLEPVLVSVYWRSSYAPAGGTVKFEVITAFVGNGAPIKITGKSENGKKLGKISDVVRNSKYRGHFEVPEDMEIGDQVYFEVSFPGNGLDGESGRIPVVPLVRVNNLKWSAKEARRGDTLTLSAFVDGVREGTEVTVTIYEYDRDSAHDKITELPATIEGGRMELQWEYQYFEDTDEIATQEELDRYGGAYNPPEYFFTIKIEDDEYGKEEQASGLLEFKDWIEIELKDETGEPAKDEKYILHLPDGTTKEGNLDSDGRARVEDIPPGTVKVEFTNLKDYTIT
ncbi:MAG: hypothetical protein DRP47_04010 [Candidatus Zixiibacteriota bacterium]|nr:MAG: hypothetical protein DRP47_04010 [candidate division Zixibacteria bacterium]